MAKITRKTQKIFAGNVSATDTVAQFGSLAAGSPQYSSDPDVIQALTAYGGGWTGALINAPGGNSSPAYQDDNAIKFLVTRQLAYLFQSGLAEWDTATIYFVGSWVQVAGICYVSKTDNNQGNLVTDANNWKTLASTFLNLGASVAKAWVNFNGITGVINSSFNVSGILRTAAGCYTLQFATPLADANYAWSGSAGVGPASSYGTGDDNFITGGVSGKTPFKAASGFNFFCFDRGDPATQDSSSISIIVFGN